MNVIIGLLSIAVSLLFFGFVIWINRTTKNWKPKKRAALGMSISAVTFILLLIVINL